MRMFAAFLFMICTMFAVTAHAGEGFVNARFTKTVYLAATGVATAGGSSYAAPKPIASGDLLTIPAGYVIERAYVIVDTVVAGATALNLGDDDSSNGFCPTASVTLGTVGLYCWDAKTAGSYLRIQTAGVTSASDIYVVPNAKLYTVAGKKLKAAVTGTATAGRVRVVVEGYYAGLK